MAFFGKNRQYERSTIGRLVSSIPKAVAELSASLPRAFPDEVAGPVIKGIEDRGRLLEAG